VRVLRHAHRLCKPGGVLLDLTTVPPSASIEAEGAVLGRLEQTAFLERAAITEAAVDRLVSQGMLVEESVLSLDVLKHFDSGADAIADLAVRPVTKLPAELRVVLETVTSPVVERAWCLLRRLRAV